MSRHQKPASPFRYFHSSPEVIRLVVMMYVRFPLSLRNVEDLLFERGRDLCHETVRFWWNRFGPMFASEIRRRRVDRMRSLPHVLGIDRVSMRDVSPIDAQRVQQRVYDRLPRDRVLVKNRNSAVVDLPEAANVQDGHDGPVPAGCQSA